MKQGRRGLEAEQSLAKVLYQHRGVRSNPVLPPFTIKQILAWVDAHHRRTGQWPNQRSGPVPEAPGLNWHSVHGALYAGRRGLPGGSSLAELLRVRRGVPNRANLPPLTLGQIAKWAREHRARTGHWPHKRLGAVMNAPALTWKTVESALRAGSRSLPRGMSLAQVLVEQCGARISLNKPRLTIERILEWADKHYQRAGRWPSIYSGRVLDEPEESWMAIDRSLRVGTRGMPGGSSLFQFFVKHRGKYDSRNPPRLTIKEILQWADAHYEATGEWPSSQSGKVIGAPHERWSVIHQAVTKGKRGLPGGSTLVKVLSSHRGALYRRRGIPLSLEQILEWAQAHHELTGRLPDKDSGAVRGQPGEQWSAIDAALRAGTRNLRGRSSLVKLLESRYRPPYKGCGQRLTMAKVLGWADDFHRRTGRWPTKTTAYVHPPPRHGERWITIDQALREGLRGLPGGSSLDKLLKAHRRKAGQR